MAAIAAYVRRATEVLAAQPADALLGGPGRVSGGRRAVDVGEAEVDGPDRGASLPRRLAIADVRAERTTAGWRRPRPNARRFARRLDLRAIQTLTADIAFKTRTAAARSRWRATCRLDVGADLRGDPGAAARPDRGGLPDPLRPGPARPATSEVDPEGAADVEPLPATAIDLGELVVQTLSLALPLSPGPRRRIFRKALSRVPSSRDERADERPDGVAETAPETAGPVRRARPAARAAD